MRGPIALLQASWNTFTAHARLFMGIYAIPALISVLMVVFFGTDTIGRDELEIMTSGEVTTLTVLIILAISMSIFASLALIVTVRDPHSWTIQSAYKASLKYLFPYFVLSVIVGVLTTIGLFLLIIPGVILIVWFTFVYFVLIYENKRGVEALKQSMAYVRGRFSDVCIRMLAFFALVIGASILISILGETLGALIASVSNIDSKAVSEILLSLSNLLLLPLAILYVYNMYQDVQGSADSISEPSPTTTSV